MARGEATTPESYKKWLLNLIKDFRSPDKDAFENVVKSDGEQKKREYEDAKADAARTGDPKDIAYAKKLKQIVDIYEDVVKARSLTDKAQALYENIDSNRKKLKALKELGEGNTEEAKKIQRQLERARGGLKDIEVERDDFGPRPKTEEKVTPSETVVAETPAPAKPETPKPAAKPGEVKPTPLPITEATTVNPVTGEVIKVSDIQPAQPGATPAKPAVGPVAVDTTGEKKAEGLASAAALNLAGTLFEHVDSLKELLKNYVDKGWSNNRFLQELRNDPWYKKNSAEIKARYTQLYNYEDLVKSGQADGSTDYEKQIQTLKNQVINKARQMGSDLASDPAAVQRAAENMYITNTGIDDALTTQIIAGAIKPIFSTLGGKPTQGYSGQALKDYQALQAAAKANGFSIADIIPGGANEQQVLQNIATGAIDINRIAQDARRLAAQGQPQYVRDLLGQGYNLDQVYAPYRQTMANILEIGDPNQIDLNDPVLRSAITDKGDMNLYDFKKALRNDSRWQYTEQAKQDVSNAAFTVLRDFGFQG